MTVADSIAPQPYQPEIAPCPFGCPLPPRVELDEKTSRWYKVHCTACYSHAGLFDTAEEAISHWNLAAEPEAALVATFAALRDVLTARRVGSLLPESASRILLEAVAETVTSPLVYKRIAAAIGEAWEDAECES